MTNTQFRNKSGLDFISIESEEFREYTFTGGQTLRILDPMWLHVSESGGHRVFDASGTSWYIPKGWLHLRWKAKAGEPHFVK